MKRRAIMEISISIPTDVLMEVLKCLPVKSLLRFRCVCKQWLSIIDDPFFVSLHRARSHSRPGGIGFLIQSGIPAKKLFSFYPGSNSEARFILSENHRLSCETIQSVEGLFCINDQIWNPSTGKKFDLPHVPCPYQSAMCFPHYLLGFNGSRNEYVVLCVYRVLRRQTKGRCFAKLLTFTTNSISCWRDVDDICHPDLYENFNHLASCFVNGVFYIYPYLTDSLVAFDIRTEKYGLVPFPRSIPIRIKKRDVSGLSPRLFPSLHNVREKLVVREFSREFIWTLEDEKGGRWEKKRKVDVRPEKWLLKSPSWSSLNPYHFLYSSIPGLNQNLDAFCRCSKLVETLFPL